MARRTDTATGHQRVLGLLAVAALAAATALAFGRVFLGRVPTWELVAAALGSVGIAALFERRGLLVATVASVVGLLLAITWIVVPQTAWYGLPSLRTIRAIGRSLEYVGQQARVRVAPTPPLPPLMLAAVTAVWTAAFSIHALAIRAGSPLLAVLPPVVLVGFADTVLDDGARPIYAISFLGAALAMVFADGIRRVRHWGPVWSGTRTSRFAASVKGSRSVAAVVVLTAVLVPGLLPGFRSGPVVDISTGGQEGIGLDPFVSILAQLDEQVATDLFRVDTGPDDPAAYWRLYALDLFDGTTWSSSDPRAGVNGVRLVTPALLPQVEPVPGFVDRISQRVTILTDVGEPWLPMAHPAENLTLADGGTVTWDPVLQQALVPGGLREGLQYTATSRVMVPTARQLDRVPPGSPPGYDRYTMVPAAVDPRVGELARQWTRGEGTPLRKVLAIQQRFHGGGFTYSTDVDPETGDDADALLRFLTSSRRGFCQQYATAMAILVRELGLPARVAVGYRPGTLVGGAHVVQTKDAHAWVEVYFAGYGWLPFEPTPGRGVHPNAQPGTYLNPRSPSAQAASVGGAGIGNARGAAGAACDGSGRIWGQLCHAEVTEQRVGAAGLPPGLLGGLGGAPTEPGYSVPYRRILFATLIALAVLVVVVPIVKWLWRRRLLRRSVDPRERVLAVYRLFEAEAADLGQGRREGETLEEHRARLATEVAFSDGHLGRLADAVGRAAYASAPPSAREADRVVRDARSSIRDLRRDAGLLRRIVGTYRPGL
jgi:transglutaminase-like putative cysteine protease